MKAYVIVRTYVRPGTLLPILCNLAVYLDKEEVSRETDRLNKKELDKRVSYSYQSFDISGPIPETLKIDNQ